MKFTKLLTASALTLALAGSSLAPTLAEEAEGNINSENTEVEEAIEIEAATEYRQEYFGDDNWLKLRYYAANYVNQLFTGSAGNSFYIDANRYDMRYYIDNLGSSAFDWKIWAPNGGLWDYGTLQPGENKTYTISPSDFYWLKGQYRYSIQSKNGGDGKYSFKMNILN